MISHSINIITPKEKLIINIGNNNDKHIHSILILMAVINTLILLRMMDKINLDSNKEIQKCLKLVKL